MTWNCKEVIKCRREIKKDRLKKVKALVMEEEVVKVVHQGKELGLKLEVKKVIAKSIDNSVYGE